MSIDTQTPVLVGVGTLTQHPDERDPTELLEPVDLMVAAARAAAVDADAPALLTAVELVAVPKGIWGYGDPGRFGGRAAGIEAEVRRGTGSHAERCDRERGPGGPAPIVRFRRNYFRNRNRRRSGGLCFE